MIVTTQAIIIRKYSVGGESLSEAQDNLRKALDNNDDVYDCFDVSETMEEVVND